MIPRDQLSQSGVSILGKSQINSTTPLTITSVTRSMVTDSKSKAFKPLSIFPKNIEIDLEPIEIKKGVDLKKTHPDFIVRLLGGFSSIPTMRKLISAPNYLVFGCILLESIIESSNTLISKTVVQAIDYLYAHQHVDVDQKFMYLEAKKNYTQIIEWVESQRDFLTKINQPDMSKKQFLKKIYEKISSQVIYKSALVVTIRAVFICYIINCPTACSNQLFIDQMLSESFSFDDEYLEDACQLFSDCFGYKVDFLEIDVRTTGRETLKKSHFLPKTTDNEYSLSCGIVRALEKSRKYVAVGYSMSPTAPVKRAEPTKSIEKTSGTDSKAVTATTAPIKTNENKLENSNGKKNSDGSKSIELTEKTSELLITCDICGAPVNKLDVFENRFCNHKFCIYCIKDSGLKVVTLCLRNKCSFPMDPVEIRKFVNDTDERAHQQENGKPSVPEEIKAQSRDTRAGTKQDNTKTCDACSEKKAKEVVFFNHCGHFYCTDCIHSKIDAKQKYCLAPKCAKLLDSEEISRFIGRQLAEEMMIVKITCRNCFRTNELHYQKTVKPEYYKCNKCNSMSCVKHNDLMSKCQCFCQVCLSALELNVKTLIKTCLRCKKHVCAACGEVKATTQMCDCLCGLCLEKKQERKTAFCDTCLSQPFYCPLCLETIDEPNEYVQTCGHKICIKCHQESHEKGAEEQSTLLSCVICSKVNTKK